MMRLRTRVGSAAAARSVVGRAIPQTISLVTATASGSSHPIHKPSCSIAAVQAYMPSNVLHRQMSSSSSSSPATGVDDGDSTAGGGDEVAAGPISGITDADPATPDTHHEVDPDDTIDDGPERTSIVFDDPYGVDPGANGASITPTQHAFALEFDSALDSQVNEDTTDTDTTTTPTDNGDITDDVHLSNILTELVAEAESEVSEDGADGDGAGVAVASTKEEIDDVEEGEAAVAELDDASEHEGDVDEVAEEEGATIDSNEKGEGRRAANPHRRTGIPFEQRVLAYRAHIWHLHRSGYYSKLIREFNMIYTSKLAPSRRLALRHPNSIYVYFFSLQQLNQYGDIMKFLKYTLGIGHLELFKSPQCIDIALTACMRQGHGNSQIVMKIWQILLKNDRETFKQIQKQTKAQMREWEANRIAALEAAAEAGSTSPPPPAPQAPPSVIPLLLTEKVMNQLLKSLLIGGRSGNAHAIWAEMSGSSSPVKPQPPDGSLFHHYRAQRYRLHAQTSYGIIMDRITRYESYDDITPKMNYAISLLTDAFRMYLQTSFVEHVIDTQLLLRIFNCTIRLASSAVSQSHLRTKRCMSLVNDIQRFILHHNEQVVREDRKKNNITTTTTQQDGPTSTTTTPTSSSSSSSAHPSPDASFALACDTPWSHMDHRSYIHLNFHHHLKPLILLRIGMVRMMPTSKHYVDQLNAALYDLRLSYPDYSHLRGMCGVDSQHFDDEIEALEEIEATQQKRYDRIRQFEEQTNSKTDGVESLYFMPIPTMRVLDVELCTDLLNLWLRTRDYTRVVELWCSIPSLSHFDSIRRMMRDKIVESLRAGGAGIRSMEENTIDTWVEIIQPIINKAERGTTMDPKFKAFLRMKQAMGHNEELTPLNANAILTEPRLLRMPEAPPPFVRPCQYDYQSIIAACTKSEYGLEILTQLERAMELDATIQPWRLKTIDIILRTYYTLLTVGVGDSEGEGEGRPTAAAVAAPTSDQITLGHWRITAIYQRAATAYWSNDSKLDLLRVDTDSHATLLSILHTSLSWWSIHRPLSYYSSSVLDDYVRLAPLLTCGNTMHGVIDPKRIKSLTPGNELIVLSKNGDMKIIPRPKKMNTNTKPTPSTPTRHTHATPKSSTRSKAEKATPKTILKATPTAAKMTTTRVSAPTSPPTSPAPSSTSAHRVGASVPAPAAAAAGSTTVLTASSSPSVSLGTLRELRRDILAQVRQQREEKNKKKNTQKTRAKP